MTCCVAVRAVIGGLLTQQLGEAEIGDLHSPAFVDQDVFGLDVAMDDAFVVGELQGVADLRHDRQGLLGVHVRRTGSPDAGSTPSTYSMMK